MKMMTRGRCARRTASSHAPVEFLKLSMASLESTLRQRDPSFMMPILLVAVEPNRGLFVVTQTAPALWIARDGSALRIDARGHLLVAIKGT